ncbi:hypothetical protein MD484_g6397, partial [Candolleomyces efflorescens]
MALKIPGLAPNIDDAMRSHPTIFTKALPIQLEKLIIDPCKKLKNHTRSRWLIVVDGLDECVGTAGSDREQEQELVLNLLISLLSHSLPFSILLFSRAESWLKEAFNSEPLSWMTQTVHLHDSALSDQDMLFYITEEFKRIATTRNVEDMHSVPKPWPPSHVPKLLVQKAKGQFVYAKTAIRFIDDRWSLPPKQLDKLLASFKRSSDTEIFSAVDALYLGILKACRNVDFMLKVLGEVMCLDHVASARTDRWGIMDQLSMRTTDFSFYDWFRQEIMDVPGQHSWFLSLSDWAWGHGLFRLGQIQAFRADSTDSATLTRCIEHFRSDYDRSMVWSLDRLARPGMLERFFDACFSTSLPGISMSTFKYEIPDSPPDYIPIISFQGKVLDVLPLKGVVEKLKLADSPQCTGEFGIHFHAFSPEFLSFLADPSRSRHHCYVTPERILWLIRTMLNDPSGFPKILEVLDDSERWPGVRTNDPFVRWFSVLSIFLDLAAPSQEIGELFAEKGPAVLGATIKLGYAHTRKRLQNAIEKHKRGY